MIPRKLGIPPLSIDANCRNTRGKLKDMNVLEKWHKDGVISIRMPWDAQIEAKKHSGQQQKKVFSYLA